MRKHLAWLLLVALCPMAMSGGGGDGDGLDILPYPTQHPGVPVYAAVIMPGSLLYDYIVSGGLPPSWPVVSLDPGYADLVVSAPEPVTDGSGAVHQPVLISGTIEGHFVSTEATLAEVDGRLAVVGPNGQLGIMFIVEPPFGYPFFYHVDLSFDPDELGEDPHDPTDDHAGRATDGNASGGVPHCIHIMKY